MKCILLAPFSIKYLLWSRLPNYYTHFVFTDLIKSPIIDNTDIKTFSKNNMKDFKMMYKMTSR